MRLRAWCEDHNTYVHGYGYREPRTDDGEDGWAFQQVPFSEASSPDFAAWIPDLDCNDLTHIGCDLSIVGEDE